MKKALKFIILFGFISLFADMTYEGGRSVTGPYLSILGVNAVLIGIISGFGEFVGYGIRVVFGAIADRTEKYWSFTLLGYILNLIAVPLLALANQWEIAIVLIIIERFGKAIRSPSKDVMLAHASSQTGRGLGFGIHEAMDQIGAVIGPLIVAGILITKNNNYSLGFGILIIPAVISLSVLFFTKKFYPNTIQFEDNSCKSKSSSILKNELDDTNHTENNENKRIKLKNEGIFKIKFSTAYKFYLLFIMTSIAGYANFQIISFHFKNFSIIPEAQIPIFFAVAMASSGISALVSGRIFDKTGLLALGVVPILTIPITPLAFSANQNAALVSIILWGTVLGIQETIVRAAIPTMISNPKRGTVYGIFNFAYGLSWFCGSTLMGFLYNISIQYIILFSIIMEIASFPLLYKVIKEVKKQ